MKNLFLGLALLVTTTVGLQAEARRGRARSIEVHLGGEQFRGQGSTLGLKRLLRQERPNLNIDRLELESVTVFAKSKQGRGSMDLMIANQSQARRRVPGNPRDFRSERAFTYHEINFWNSNRSDRGRWVLSMSGNIKIDSIIFEFSRNGGGGNGRLISLGKERVDKFVSERRTFHVPRRTSANEVVIQADSGRILVESVEVHFDNGRSRILHQMSNQLIRNGEQLTSQLRRGNITAVTVIATSPIRRGSRGVYEVLVSGSTRGGGGNWGDGDRRPGRRPGRR